MKTAALIVSLSLAGGTLVAQDGTVRSLLSKDLAGVPGRELSMITVEYPPGGSTPAHTHHAQALVYVLEGSIVMQVKGGAPVTLTPGQTWSRGTGRRARRQPKREQDGAGQVPGVPGEGQRRTDSDAGQVTTVAASASLGHSRHRSATLNRINTERDIDHETRHHRRHRAHRIEARDQDCGNTAMRPCRHRQTRASTPSPARAWLRPFRARRSSSTSRTPRRSRTRRSWSSSPRPRAICSRPPAPPA